MYYITQYSTVVELTFGPCDLAEFVRGTGSGGREREGGKERERRRGGRGGGEEGGEREM